MTPRTRNRLTLAGIAAVAVAPVLGSYLLYWFWAPERFTNYGTLIEAKPPPKVELVVASGEPFAFEQLKGRWVFVTTDSGACDAGCEHKLWKMRQVRQAQGKELGRIEDNYGRYFGFGQAWRMATPGFAEQFRRMLMSKLRVVFENAAGEIELWSKAASGQVELQLRERRRAFARRREALQDAGERFAWAMDLPLKGNVGKGESIHVKRSIS